MQTDLTRPCKLCPFRTDCLKGWLGRERAEEITEALLNDQSFACHETVDHTNDEDDQPHVTGPNEQHCAGAMILLEKLELANQWMRISERLGFYDRTKLDMKAEVFDSFEEFIDRHDKHHERKHKRKPK